MLNDNLEQQIKTIFTFQFLQNANTEWKQQSLAELSEMYQPKTISGKDLIAVGNYFVYGANGIIGKYNQYNHSESEIAVACRGASCGSIQMTLPFSWITGNAKNLTKFGTIDFSKCDFIDEDAKKIIHKRSDIRRGDILFSSRAPIGHCHLITEDPDFYDIGESIFSIRVNQDVALPEYLCLYLASDYFVKVASKHTTGSIIMEIRISDLMNTEIIIPPREIQKNIAKCLNKIDRKIELNKMVNDNLEQQLMLLYDYWFIQFDFPDNNGNPYQISGGKMVWNDTLRRNIPENWKVQSVISNCLSSVIKPGVKIFNTKTYLATADVKGTSISTGTIVDYDGRESRANMQPSINSVWFAKMKNSIKHLYLNKEMQPIISSSILSTGFCGLQCNEISFEYIASYVSNAYFENSLLFLQKRFVPKKTKIRFQK